MSKPQFSEARLGMIAAPSARWPAADVANFWRTAHETVAALVAVAWKADVDIAQVESNSDLSDVGRIRAAAEIALRAVNGLDSLSELAKMRSQAERDIALFESKVGGVPAAPSDPSEAMLQAEIRTFIRQQAEPVSALYKHRNDARVVSAVANALGFLSGLTEELKVEFTAAARSALWPDETGRIETFRNAVRVASLDGNGGNVDKTVIAKPRAE